MRAYALTFAATLALILAAPAAAHRRDCYPRGSRTVVANAVERAYVWRRGGFGRFWACLYRVGRSFPLGPSGWDGMFGSYVRPILLERRYVAYNRVVDRCPDCDLPFSVRVLDLRTGRLVHQHDGFLEPDGGEALVKMLATPTGAVAWLVEIDEGPPAYASDWEVGASDRRRENMRLDFGSRIDSRSFELHGRTLSWVDDGQLCSYMLH